VPLNENGYFLFDWYNVDGVATQKHKNKVYKVPDMADVQIMEDGEVEPLEPVSEAIISYKGGGWKDESWLESLQSMGDHKWDELFEAAKKI